MRNFLVILVLGGLGLLYLWQRNSQTPQPEQARSAERSAAVATATPVPPDQVSEHNWMKRSLDRARDVTQQARARTKDSQDP
jgi:hypothetical protein